MGNIEIKLVEEKILIRSNEPFLRINYGFERYGGDGHSIYIKSDFQEYSINELKMIYELNIENYIGYKLDKFSDQNSILLSASILMLEKFLLELLGEEKLSEFRTEVVNYFLKYNSCERLVDTDNKGIIDLNKKCKEIQTIIENIKNDPLTIQLSNKWLMSIDGGINDIEKGLLDIYKVVNRFNRHKELKENFLEIVRNDTQALYII